MGNFGIIYHYEQKIHSEQIISFSRDKYENIDMPRHTDTILCFANLTRNSVSSSIRG